MRMIDGDALKEEIDYYIREAGWGETHNETLRWCLEFIDDQPIIEPQRKTGEWIPKSESGCIIECSSCGERMTVLGDENPNYCPYCGADMQGDQNELN